MAANGRTTLMATLLALLLALLATLAREFGASLRPDQVVG